jgi:hypothetical protein
MRETLAKAHGLVRHLGLELAVLFQDLNRHAAQLAAIALDDKHEAVVLVLAHCALRARQFPEKTDLDRGLRMGR